VTPPILVYPLVIMLTATSPVGRRKAVPVRGARKTPSLETRNPKRGAAAPGFRSDFTLANSM
jgi:hypothetical protein